jgi:dihydroxyacid dehydratase/phosphogluconate dehydratase
MQNVQEFTPISVSDIILMGHEGMKCSLISRERSEHAVVLYYSYDQIRWVFHFNKEPIFHDA